MIEYKDPPKFPLRFLRWFCNEHRLEEIEGDLYEMYNELLNKSSKTKAQVWYLIWVFKSLQPFALKRRRSKNSTYLQLLMMNLRHNFKVSYRSIYKYKSTSMINILGLILGIVSFVSIFRIVQYELSYNKDIVEAEKIYRINTRFVGAFSGTNPGVTLALHDFMEENNPSYEHISPVYTWNCFLNIESESRKERINDIDLVIVKPSYFDIIDQYSWLSGNSQSLADAGKVVLLKEQAEKYFGLLPPGKVLGNIIEYNDSIKAEVVGVVEIKNKPTDFIFTDFLSFETTVASGLKYRYKEKDWSSVSSSDQLWIKVEEPLNIHDQKDFIQLANEKVDELQKEEIFKTQFELQPLSELHYDANFGLFNNSVTQIANKKTLLILSLIAFAILGIAIFNFVNIAIAQAGYKMKEVGIRKTLGSKKNQLISRFLAESFILTFTAGVLAIPAIFYVFKFFNSEMPHGITTGFEDPVFLAQYFGILCFIAFVAGFYPSFIISAFPTMNALKNSGATQTYGTGKNWLRKLLISLQFIFSQLLIIFTVVVYFQIDYLLNKEMGFTRENVLYFSLPFHSPASDPELIKTELSAFSEIEDIVIQSNPPAYNGWSTRIIQYHDGEEKVDLDIHSKRGEPKYIDFYEIELIAGRKYSSTDSTNEVLVNRALMDELGLKEPNELLNKKLSNLTIVGVVENFNIQSLHHKIEPTLIELHDDYSKTISFKTKGQNTKAAIEKVSSILEDKYPNRQINIEFLDETIENFYKTEKRTSRLSSVATILALIISCLGLYGLVSQIVIQRTKEVGIRKVLGASLYQLGLVISKEFIFILAASYIITLPIAIYLVKDWIADFEYKANIGIWIYAVTGLVTVLIALLSIILKVTKASLANPVDSLKYE